MPFVLFVALIVVGLFAGMLLMLKLGRRLGVRQLARDPENALAGTGAVDGALFGLLGLLIAFTFQGAASRFDARRNLIIDETNAIGTAYLRLDALPPSVRPEVQQLFREYLDLRLEGYRKLPDVEAAMATLARAAALTREIWARSVAGIKMPDALPSATFLLLPALNNMFDIANTRTLNAEIHPPIVIWIMLFGMALIGALLAGYGMARRKSPSWLHMIGFAVITSLAIYVIVDLEYPRVGTIRVASFDRALLELRASMR